MKTAVIYRSKTGFTKRYAEWIAEALGGELIEGSKVKAEMLADYDTIIYGGGLYAVGINGAKLITDNLNTLIGKKVVIFATGASPARPDVVKEVREKNLNPAQQEKIQFFYLRGGFEYGRLKAVDRVLMTLLKLKLKLKKELTPDEKGMLAAYSKPVDFTAKKKIESLVAYVKGD